MMEILTGHSIEYVAIFGFGMLSSLHCLGMCGPIVLAYSAQLQAAGSNAFSKSMTLAHILYNFGRITTYALVGALMGGLGKFLHLGFSFVGFQNAVALMGGGLLIWFGLMHLNWLPQVRFLGENIVFRRESWRKALARLMGPQNLRGKYLLGILLGFIPCMLTYAMFARALASQSAVQGFLILLFFGLGTLPMLFLTGMASSLLSRRVRTWGNKLAGVGIVVIGVVLILRVTYMPATGHHNMRHTVPVEQPARR